MRHTLFVLLAVASACNGPASTADTDLLLGRDTADTDADDSDVVDSDVVDTDADDSDVVDSHIADTDAADTDEIDTDIADTDGDTARPLHRGWCFEGAGEDTTDTAHDSAPTWFDTGTWAHLLANGAVGDWMGRLRTSADQRAVFSTLGWQSRNLIVGLRDPDLTPGRADLAVVAYLGDSSSTGTQGLPGVTRTATLAVPATWAVRWTTDNSALELWAWRAGAWHLEPLPAHMRAVPTTDAPGVELQIPFTLLGCDPASTATWMLVDQTTGATTSASPSESIVEGADPDVGCAFTFDPRLGHALTYLLGQCGQTRRPGMYLDTSTP